ncbi:MAG: amidase [Spirochaetales bacterium]|nr:amidase [Spirochaetales bacterium]
MAYDLKSVRVVRLSGLPLRIFTRLLESFLRSLILPPLFRDAGITAFRSRIMTDDPTCLPVRAADPAAAQPDVIRISDLSNLKPATARGFHFPSVLDYARAYAEGLSPLIVAERLLKAIESSNQGGRPLRAVTVCHPEDVLQQARAATERWKAGKPLSVLDGVPVLVKDELDQAGYPTSVGTRFLGKTVALQDAEVVSRLRSAGALLGGKLNMHEIGIGVTGLNPHWGCTRNPYHLDHHTGGSSSGSGAAVAAGLAPVAVGADGGGSIRIPAAFCGVFGLKATLGRISETGAYPLCWSVAHVGPLGATATDTAILYALMAGKDEAYRPSLLQPAVHLEQWDRSDLADLTVGIYPEFLEHATPEIVRESKKAIETFTALGARIVDIEIAGLEEMRVAHAITIASEMAQSMDEFYDSHRADFGLDVRVNLALARTFGSLDYIMAQRQRTRMISIFDELFKKVDIIFTPATGIVAPPIRPAALPRGESDLSTLTEIMRFIYAGNFVGLPALSFPLAYNEKGLPIAGQVMGRHWEEHHLLRIARLMEATVERRRPEVFFDLLA